MGLQSHLHPDDTARMLPAKVDLSEVESAVLDGILPMTARYREDERCRHGISQTDFDAVFGHFVQLGLW